MTLQTWLLFCVTETILCLIPGPAVLFVLSTALRRGCSSSAVAALGILAGNTFYFALSATGIAAVIVTSHEVFTVIKWTGASYLVWLGLRMLFSRSSAHSDTPSTLEDGRNRVLVRAFVVQASNPKAILFFVALLPQFINPSFAVPEQILILGVSSVIIEFIVLSMYGALAAQARSVARRRFANALERAGGAVLVAAGARLAWLRS